MRVEALRAGISEVVEGEFRLIASREADSGAIQFPPTDRPGWASVALPALGALVSWSRVEMAAPNFPAGYTVGVVEFVLDGARVLVFGQLRGPAGHEHRFAEPMRTVEVALWREPGEAGETEVRGFAFVPEVAR